MTPDATPARRNARTWRTAAWLSIVLVALAGCQTLQELSPEKRREAEVTAELQRLQAQNMRFADEYVSRLVQAGRRTEASLTDPELRFLLSGWLLAQANTVYIDASGENAIVGTIDLVALATLSRMVMEDWAREQPSIEANPLVDVHRDLETSAWQLAGQVLSATQQEDLRRVLVDWRAKNPDVRNAPFIRFKEFATLTPASVDGQRKVHLPGSLMGIVGLDPMAGLDPAVRQIEQSRLLAERAVFYAQRVPVLIDLQLDRSLNRLAAGPESLKLQRQSASLTDSAARFASVAEALPATLSGEREALIDQMSSMLTQQAATLTPMLIELRGALEAGHVAATSVDDAVKSIDALVGRFEHEPGEPRGRPFDVTEYGRAAADIAQAADRLQVLLASADTKAPQFSRAFASGAAEGRALVDYLFVRVAWLIALFCVGLLATLLLYRWLAPRIART